MAYVSVSVDVDLSEIDTEDLIEELNRRADFESGLPCDATPFIERMRLFACSGNDAQLLHATNQFLYECIGTMPKNYN